MTDASPGPPGFGKFGSIYPAYSDVGGPDILSRNLGTNTVIDALKDYYLLFPRTVPK